MRVPGSLEIVEDGFARRSYMQHKDEEDRDRLRVDAASMASQDAVSFNICLSGCSMTRFWLECVPVGMETLDFEL